MGLIISTQALALIRPWQASHKLLDILRSSMRHLILLLICSRPSFTLALAGQLSLTAFQHSLAPLLPHSFVMKSHGIHLLKDLLHHYHPLGLLLVSLFKHSDIQVLSNLFKSKSFSRLKRSLACLSFISHCFWTSGAPLPLCCTNL